MRSLSWTTLAAAIACSLALSSTAVAADGYLDTPFDFDGVSDLPGGHLPKLAVQPDGKTVVAGEAGGGDTTLLVRRITTTGALDNGFGDHGTVVLSATGGLRMGDVAIAPDGKIVVAATQGAAPNGDATVFRLNADGTPDSGFGVAGTRSFDFVPSTDSEVTGMAVEADGRVVVGGSANIGGEHNLGLGRLTVGGDLDAAFSGDGVTTEDIGSSLPPSDLLLQGDRIVVIGTYGPDVDPTTAAVRFTASGTPDSSFGPRNTGASAGSSGGPRGFSGNGIVTRDGGLMVSYVAEQRIGVWKLTEAGISDSGFGGGDGVFYVAEPGGSPSVSRTVDGKYAVAFESNSILRTFKVTPTGAIDPSWGGDGGVRRYSSLSPFDTSDLVLGTDGNLLVGGSYAGGMGVARLLDSLPELDLNGATVREGQVLPFTAQLSKTSGFPVSFNFVTGEGSAASGRDYVGRSGTTRIPPGDTLVPIGVVTILDHAFENDESLRLEVSDVAGARVDELITGGTIRNVLRSGRCVNIVDGHKGTDILTGSPAGDRMIGRNDIDYLYGLGGADCIYGQRAGDYIDGGSGNDLIDGGSGDDQLKGGTGNDRIYGRAGRNRYNGGPGRDVINSRNAVAEIVDCGSGRDTVRADVRDRLRHCERVIH